MFLLYIHNNKIFVITNKPIKCNMIIDFVHKDSDVYTANIFEVILTVFNCVPISTVISLYGLHLIAAPSTVKKL